VRTLAGAAEPDEPRSFSLPYPVTSTAGAAVTWLREIRDEHIPLTSISFASGGWLPITLGTTGGTP
jgi:hypothetical protein